MSLYQKCQDVETLAGQDGYHSCGYPVSFTSWPSMYDRFVGEEEIRLVTVLRKRKRGPSAICLVQF